MNGDESNATPAYQARRANLEDLPSLRSLWHQAHLPGEELEKRFTEFQVVQGADGNILAAVGLQMLRQNGYIHSEVFSDPSVAAETRPLLWQRILAVAKNNGLLRLWVLPTASFYREQGFTDVDDALRQKVPPEFGNPGADWISLKLKDDSQAVLSAEREFEIFAMAQREESQRMISQAKALRMMAYGLLFLAMLAVAALAYVYSRIKNKSR